MTTLLDCLGIDARTRIIALVGAGGKTSLLYALAREMTALRGSVVTTTTTKIFPPLPDESPCLVLLDQDPHLSSLSASLTKFAHVTVADRVDTKTGKLTGVTDDVVEICAHKAQWVVVEADGAARHPVKAPAPWEPVLPSGTDLLICLIGLNCLGKPVGEDWVFRVPEFCSVTGLAEGEEITPEDLARLVVHPKGGMKGVASSTRVIPFLNKMDRVPVALAEKTARALLSASEGRIRRVVVGTLKPLVRVTAYS